MTYQNLEQSAMSRSMNSEASALQSNLLKGRVSIIDSIFPFVDQMTQFSAIPNFINFIFSLYTALQILFVSLYTSSNYWIYGNKTWCDIIDHISQIFFFVTIKLPYQKKSDLEDIDIEIRNEFDENYLTSVLIAIAIIFALVLASLLFHCFYYLLHHRFLESMLIVTRFFIENVSQAMIIPTAAFTGASLLMVCRDKGSKYWAYFFIGLIFCLFFLLFYSIEMILITRCVIVNPSPMASFTVTYYLETLIINSIVIMTSYLFQALKSWTSEISPILHLVITILILIPTIRNIPYYHSLANTFYESILSAGAFSDLIFFVTFILDKKSVFKMITFVFLFIALVIAFIVYFIVNKIYIKKIEKIMNTRTFDCNLSEETENDNQNQNYSEDFVSYYTNFGFLDEPTKSLTYLHISFSHYFYHFYDWSLLKFLVTKMPSNIVLTACLQFVSYFPSESRMTNELFKQLLKKNDLKFEQRFLIFQVNKIKRSRASSSSMEANEQLSNLKSLSDELLSNICAFYSQPDIECSVVEQIAQKKKKIRSLWLETLRNYPNSIKIHEEYIKFLTESETDFRNAIIAQERIEMIENGKNFSVDNSFKSMIRAFPQYLMKEIVDLDGKINLKQKTEEKPASHVDLNEMSRLSLKADSSQSAASTNSTVMNLALTNNDQELDNDVEKDFSKRMFRQSKLRMALFHSLEDRKFFGELSIPLFSVISLIFSVALFASFYVFTTNDYSMRENEIDMLDYMSQTQFHLTLSITILLYSMADNIGRMVPIDESYDFSDDDLSFDMLIDFNNDLSGQALFYINLAMTNYHLISEHISELSKKNVNPYEELSELVLDSSPFWTCNNGVTMNETFKLNVNNVYGILFYLVKSLGSRNDWETWYHDDEYCQLQMNLDESSSVLNNLFTNICEYQISQGDKLSKSATVLKIAFPIVIFVVTFAPMCAISLAYVVHINKFITAYQDVNKEGRVEIIKPIYKQSEDEEHPTSPISSGLTKIVLFDVIIFILCLAAAIMFFFMIQMLDKGSSNITQIVKWELYSSNIFSKSLEGLQLIGHVVILNDTSMSSFTSRQLKEDRLNEIIPIIRENYLKFFLGTEDSKPIAGFDDILDDLSVKEECSLPEQVKDIHDTYRCESTQKMYSSYINLIQPTLVAPEAYEGKIQGLEPSHLIELMNRHFLYKLNQIAQRLSELVSIEEDKMRKESVIFLVLGILILIVEFIFCLVILRFTTETFYTVLSLGRRIPPHQIVSSRLMKSTLLNQSDAEQELAIVSISQNILHNSKDAIIITTESLIIEVVNPAITDILGFTPDQLLGQSVSIVFREKDGESIIKEMETMKEGQNPTIYENHYHCISDSMNEIPCLVTALGMKNDTIINSFVFILRDETEITKQQEEAEKAKSVSENLLYQILPRDIVTKLNRGEKDISFTVKSASIIFIDLVKFSEYSSNLTPSEIMGNLSEVFSSYDRNLKKYPLIIKIKLIGDDYMAAAGLFETEDNAKEHSTQTLHFGLDCIVSLEEVNMKLDANLQCRVGMNTSGPLIAGVLGTNKPVFDIIGDPINVAARLQTTDVPGKVQITQNTYEYLPISELNIEPRGEVFLKGKGKAMTYLVSPGMSITSISASSIET